MAKSIGAAKMPKEWSGLIKALRRDGWTIEGTKNGHFKAHPPGGGPHVVMSGSHFAMKRAVAALRKAGWAG